MNFIMLLPGILVGVSALALLSIPFFARKSNKPPTKKQLVNVKKGIVKLRFSNGEAAWYNVTGNAKNVYFCEQKNKWIVQAPIILGDVPLVQIDITKFVDSNTYYINWKHVVEYTLEEGSVEDFFVEREVV